MASPSAFDEKTLEQLFRGHYAGLCRFATGYVKQQEAAQEIVQEAFVSLWEKRHVIDPERQVKSYLSTTVRNKCLNYLRDNRKFSSDLLAIENHPDTASYDQPDKLVEQELRVKIDRAIAELPEKCREVFVLNRYSSLKYQQIADRLGISVKTVETQMSKALQHLRLRLAEYLPALIMIMLSRYFTILPFMILPFCHFFAAALRVTPYFGV